MKPSSWFFWGMILGVVAGLVFIGVGFLQPGRFEVVENPGGNGKPLLLEAKKKTEAIRQAREMAAGAAHEFSGGRNRSGMEKGVPT